MLLLINLLCARSDECSLGHRGSGYQTGCNSNSCSYNQGCRGYSDRNGWKQRWEGHGFYYGGNLGYFDVIVYPVDLQTLFASKSSVGHQIQIYLSFYLCLPACFFVYRHSQGKLTGG